MPETPFPSDGMEMTTLLVVSDIDRSVRFYRDVLGANLHAFFRDPDGHLLEISELVASG